MHYYDSENDQLSFNWEWPDVIELVGGSPTATTITGFSGLTVNEYAGQMLNVLDGNQQGYSYWVISNTATVLTVQGTQGVAPNSATPGAIEADARVAISTNGLNPSSDGSGLTKSFGIVGNCTLPDPEPEIKEHFGHGGGVKRVASSVPKIEFPGKLPIEVLDPEILLCLGEVHCTGTEKSSGHMDTTLDGAHTFWNDIISVADSTNIAVDDYITVDYGGSTPETRKVTAVNTNDLTLEFPLLLAHATGVTVVEVEAPYTTTITPTGTLLRSLTMCHVSTDPYGEQADLIRLTSGVYGDVADIIGTKDDYLKVELGIKGMNDNGGHNPSGVSKPTVETDTYTFFPWDDGVLQRDSVTIAVPEESRVQWKNGLISKRGIVTRATNTEKRPYRIIREGKPAFSHNCKYLPLSSDLLSEQREPSEKAGYVQYVRGTNDNIKINTYYGRAKGKWNRKDKGPYDAEFNDMPQYVDIVITSTSPYA